MWVIAAAALLAAVPARASVDWLAIDRELAASGAGYEVRVSEPRFVVPSAGLPSDVDLQESNNCVGIELYNGTLFMGFRTAPFHFASRKAKIHLVSSGDMGRTWAPEATISVGRDVREPYFLVKDGRLFFSFFSAGTNPLAFQPHGLWHMEYEGPGRWRRPEALGTPGEIAWQLGVHGGKAYATSYRGSHYTLTSRPAVNLYFNESDDGWNWRPVNGGDGVVYRGGVSEVGWAFDVAGDLWAVMRNEDGDTSGWGSRIAHARSVDLAQWEMIPADKSRDEIYESPRMFRHADELFLVARRDPDGPYWNHNLDWLPWELEHDLILGTYSLRPHRTAIWRLARAQDAEGKWSAELEHVTDIPGCGDTAFPSIVRIGKHRYLIANYSSPLKKCASWSWIHGQISPEGTQIYLLEVEFVPKAA